MPYLFSPSTLGFYPKEDADIYRESGTLPTDTVDVSEADFIEFALNTPPDGMQRGADSSGAPAWVKKITVHSPRLERFWRDAELKKSDAAINMIQDSDTNAIGTIDGWRAYRRALRAWPQDPGFPDQNQRPKYL